MSCNLTKSLQESIANTPRLLESKEWLPHLKNCPYCRQEATMLDKTLELYLQLEKAESDQLPEFHIWETIEPKLKNSHQTKRFSQWSKYLAIAASVVLFLGMASWWQSANTPKLSSLDPPTHYPIEEISMNQPFGPPSSKTRFIWTKERFGISIQNTQEGNYSKISIGMNLSKDYAHSPNLEQATDLPILAYLPPEEKNFSTPLQ